MPVTELATIPCWRSGRAECTITLLVRDADRAVFETRVRLGGRCTPASTKHAKHPQRTPTYCRTSRIPPPA